MKSAVVVKLGGSALDNLEPMLDLVEKTLAHRPVVIVHGGGPQISECLTRMGHVPRFLNGLRVTDETTLEVATQVLSGSVNKQIVSALQTRGCRASGLCGVDGATIRASLKNNGSLGFVGDRLKVETDLLQALLSTGFIPVLAPLGLTVQGQILNVNADTAAAAVAIALKASQLLFLTDVDGVLDSQGQVIETLDPSALRGLVDEGGVSSGMLPKLEAAMAAAKGGVAQVHIRSVQSSLGTFVKNHRLVA